MRYKESNDGVTVHAITGTYVVMLAMDIQPSKRSGLLGWAIEREDHNEDEKYWLRGMRTFEASMPNPPKGSLVSTLFHPIQDFVWSDFTAKPGYKYTYRVVPVYGKPKKLEYGTAVELTVRTEKPAGGIHDIYFNRGVIGSQAYARKFKNADPRKLIGHEREESYEWLSRGLFEAARDFIRQADNKNMGLRAAVYEFSEEDIIREFGVAQKKCNDVQIVYDARIKIVKGERDEKMIKRVAKVKANLKKYGLDAVSTPRVESSSYISHNKFIILMQNNKPVSVWTGSTNFTESGLYGQSNVGHVVNDPEVARAYLRYWERLQQDPEVRNLADENEQDNPDAPDLNHLPKGITPIFSPRADKSMLQWYADVMDQADTLMCFTGAFGVNKVFIDVLKTPPKNNNNDLRHLFLEKWGIGQERSAATKKDLERNRHNLVAVGGFLKGDVLHEYLAERWAEERMNTISTNVRYTHGKYMLVDPLGADPIVVSGSANFSDASTKQNDENMLIIRGDTRVADIYLGEFMRLWQHYRFRSIVNKLADEIGAEDAGYEPNYLIEDDSWTDDYFDPRDLKCKRRVTFNKVHVPNYAGAVR